MSETAVAERPLTHFQPDKAFSSETRGFEQTEFVVDPSSGLIIKAGNARDVTAWIEGERGRATAERPVDISVVRGGVMLPGFVDAHAHPFLFSGIELPNPTDVSGAETKEQLIAILKKAVNDKEPGKFVVAQGFDTSKIKNLTRRDLDEVSPHHKIVVYDPSYHGCVVNSKAFDEVERYGKDYERKTGKLRGVKQANGHLKESWVYMTFELIEAEESVERLVEATRATFEDHLTRGITTIQDLELGTYQEVIAYFMLRQEMGDKIPVSEIYLQPRTLRYVLSQIEDLRGRGLVSGEDDIQSLIKERVLGIKLYADGSFGTHTALIDEPYEDTHGHGFTFYTNRMFDDAIRLAKEMGVENIGVHAIGDRGIQRAVNTAKKWRVLAEKAHLDPTRFRIEHYEMPTAEINRQVAELGIWAVPQPNFIADDLIYSDRVGERIRMICPHKDILNQGVPMMLGSDSMPTSALFGIFMATHAPEVSQRLTFAEALLAYTLASGRYEGKARGELKEGQQADIVVLDQKGVDQVLEGGPLGTSDKIDSGEVRAALDANVQRVFRLGEEVHRRSA
ncbi:MAG: metal dependent amidohydrolase superfamily protein [Microgenomates group bacterium Gr01-1014_7]|nr:MAG: metal dependent amidohydrolase superfamily protein [Microgenomates group bacterium Gr01-1014_7]